MRRKNMSQAFGTKAETLALLRARGFDVPPLFFFETSQWRLAPDHVISSITRQFSDEPLAVRSSARAEDTESESLAGAFHSVLHVPCREDALRAAIEEVTTLFRSHEDQVLVQPMLRDVSMAGVIMTRALDDGSPYYVFNYDDMSGRTDTVTGGSHTAKTVHVYKGVSDEDFDSPRLREALRLARALETLFDNTSLDIEFAVDGEGRTWLLQVRPICSSRHWKSKAAVGVSDRIRHVEEFVRTAMRPRPGLHGSRTMYGVMPDWNPAEIIGLVPRPLAFSLYREVITRQVWSEARALMGYHAVPPTDLMVSVAGRPYIDVRASFNSFLPAGLPAPLAEKLINAWLDRLDAHPELHDKVEFDIVSTVLDMDVEECLEQRYPGLLSADERKVYLDALRRLTNTALAPQGTLQTALTQVDSLLQSPLPSLGATQDTADLVVQLPALLEDCRRRGTLPFSVAARHAFMAESLLRSAVRCGALDRDRLDAFKRAIPTISGELSRDFAAACDDVSLRGAFLARYGHLRPGTYDILSPSYAQRPDIFMVEGNTAAGEGRHAPDVHTFALSSEEESRLAALLERVRLDTTPQGLLNYARTAIAGREYAKFVFTRHLSHALELLTVWGKGLRLSRTQVAMVPVGAVLDTLFSPLPAEARQHFLGMVRQQQFLYDLASSFKLSQLIRSPRDVYIAPMHRAAPNFITTKRVEAPVVHLSAEDVGVELGGRLVCIESADPGYDWIFTRGIAGLVTRFGGANSHMAIRCAEYGLPAAIGCGTLLFERAAAAPSCILDCGGKSLRPLGNDEKIL